MSSTVSQFKAKSLGLDNYLTLAGGTMTGNLDMGALPIVGAGIVNAVIKMDEGRLLSGTTLDSLNWVDRVLTNAANDKILLNWQGDTLQTPYGLNADQSGLMGGATVITAVASGFATGVDGSSDSGYGIDGSSNIGTGINGYSSSGYGVGAFSSSGYGVYSYSNTGVGIYGESDSGNHADFGAGKVVIANDGDITSVGAIASTKVDYAFAPAETTLTVSNNFVRLAGDAGGNTISEIIGGVSGQILTLLFTDALITITDTNSATANTINISSAFTSTANDTLTLIFDGNKWFEISRSIN